MAYCRPVAGTMATPFRAAADSAAYSRGVKVLWSSRRAVPSQIHGKQGNLHLEGTSL